MVLFEALRLGRRRSNAEGELELLTDRQLHLVNKALAMVAVAIERRPGRLEITSPMKALLSGSPAEVEF